MESKPQLWQKESSTSPMEEEQTPQRGYPLGETPGCRCRVALTSLAQCVQVPQKCWPRTAWPSGVEKQRCGRRQKESRSGGERKKRREKRQWQGEERDRKGEWDPHQKREDAYSRSGPAGRWQQVVEPNTWVSRHPAACVGGDPGLGRWAAVAVSTTMMESTQKKLRRRKRAEGNGEEKEKAERGKAERK